MLTLAIIVPNHGKADLAGYSRRWKVERTYAWLGNYRRLVVRYEWLSHVYLAFVMVAFILISLSANRTMAPCRPNGGLSDDPV
jgi:transposase